MEYDTVNTMYIGFVETVRCLKQYGECVGESNKYGDIISPHCTTVSQKSLNECICSFSLSSIFLEKTTFIETTNPHTQIKGPL